MAALELSPDHDPGGKGKRWKVWGGGRVADFPLQSRTPWTPGSQGPDGAQEAAFWNLEPGKNTMLPGTASLWVSPHVATGPARWAQL